MSAYDLNDFCCNIRPVIRAINLFVQILRWSVPLLLIILGSIDMFKVVSTGDEKMATEVRTTFMKRVMYGILVFLVPFAINLILDFAAGAIADNSGYTPYNAWVGCWNGIVDNSFKCSEKADDTSSNSNNNNSNNNNNNNNSNVPDTSLLTNSCFVYGSPKLGCDEENGQYLYNGVCYQANDTREASCKNTFGYMVWDGNSGKCLTLGTAYPLVRSGATTISKSVPTNTYDGNVGHYKCVSSDCNKYSSNYASQCYKTEDIKVEKTSYSYEYPCLKYTTCTSGTYYDGECYSSVKSASGWVDCETGIANRNAGCKWLGNNTCACGGIVEGAYVVTKFSSGGISKELKPVMSYCKDTCSSTSASSCS